jgi:colicin import membrane protein
MTEAIHDNWRFLLAALVLHAALAVMLTVNLSSMNRKVVVPSQLAIKARVIDQSAIRRVQEREQAAEDERRAKQQAEEEARLHEQEEAKQAEQQKLEQQKAQQQAEQQKKADIMLREAVAKKQREQAEKDRVAGVKRKQKEADDKKRADLEKRAQVQREIELKQQMAEEEGRMQARNSGMLNQYVALIEQHVIRHWNKPPSARAGIACEVKVTQAPGGTVLSVRVAKCNGDQAVVRSIEDAVNRASPLPAPPDPRLFERVLLIIFKPNE